MAGFAGPPAAPPPRPPRCAETPTLAATSAAAPNIAREYLFIVGVLLGGSKRTRPTYRTSMTRPTYHVDDLPPYVGRVLLDPASLRQRKRKHVRVRRNGHVLFAVHHIG